MRPDTCQKCVQIRIEKDNYLRGPQEGRYEWLCGACYNIEGMISMPKWKSPEYPKSRVGSTTKIPSDS